jgi:uncharacterized protein YuzE
MLRHAIGFCASVALLAGCMGGARVSKDVVDLARETRTGGEFVIEVDESGKVINADAQVEVSRVPKAVMDVADREVPGPVASAEREIAGKSHYWEVEKKVQGRSVFLMISADGKVVGRETELPRNEWPQHVVDAANKAVPTGPIKTIELVTGPEALGGTEYHVKKDIGGEVLRISVLENGTVTRYVRKIKGEFKPPR